MRNIGDQLSLVQDNACCCIDVIQAIPGYQLAPSAQASLTKCIAPLSDMADLDWGLLRPSSEYF